MNIKFDNSHKKIDVKKLNLGRKNRLNISIGSLALSLAMLSGCGNADLLNNNNNNDDDDRLILSYEASDSSSDTDLNEEKFIDNKDVSVTPKKVRSAMFDVSCASLIMMKDGSTYEGKEISIADLYNVDYISLVLSEDTDCSFLNYASNLRFLNIFEKSRNCKMLNVDGSSLPDGMEIHFDILNFSASKAFNYENYPFIKDIGNISKLVIGDKKASYDLSSGYLNELDNVDSIAISVDEYSNLNNLDFKNIKSLLIIGEPYNLGIYINKVDIERLEESSVKVRVFNPDYKNIKQDVLEISDKIDEIYNGLKIKDSDSDIDKLNKILTYVLNAYVYDPYVMKSLDSGEIDYELDDAFIEGGGLYACLNKNTQICVNYASMVSALCKRAGISNFLLVSDDHAWNAVKIGDYYYYSDSTWLDMQEVSIVHEKHNPKTGFSSVVIDATLNAEDVFNENDTKNIIRLSWYLENPVNYPFDEGHHDLFIQPSAFELVDVPEEVRYNIISRMDDESYSISNRDITNNYYKVKYNGKDYVVPAIVLFSILSACGLGILIHKKKIKKDKNAEENDTYDGFLSFYDFDDDKTNHL